MQNIEDQKKSGDLFWEDRDPGGDKISAALIFILQKGRSISEKVFFCFCFGKRSIAPLGNAA